MAYKNNWATGELIDATAFQELVNSAVYSFASLSAIQSNITSAIDGQIAFAQDTESYSLLGGQCYKQTKLVR